MDQLQDRIRRHSGELLGFLVRRAPRESAEELAQETWLKVARARPDCSDDAAFRAYAFTVARRVLIDHHRRRSVRPQLVQVDALPEAGASHGPDTHVQADQVLSVVEAELGRMKPELAQVFRWRMTEDLTFQEIAQRQEVPLNTALGRMHRATKRIANALAEHGLSPLES